MAFASLQCPNCGGNDIDLKHEGTVADPYVCNLCLSKLMFQDNAFHVMIDNSPTQDSLLERAKIELSGENYASAGRCIDQFLDINPKCAEAYMLRLCTGIRAKDIASLGNKPTDFSQSPDYLTALRFANDSQKEEWEALARKAQEVARLQNSLDALKKERESLTQELENFEQVLSKRTGVFGTVLAGGYLLFCFFGGVFLVICAIVAAALKTNFFATVFVAAILAVIGLAVFAIISDSSQKSKDSAKLSQLRSKKQEAEESIS